MKLLVTTLGRRWHTFVMARLLYLIGPLLILLLAMLGISYWANRQLAVDQQSLVNRTLQAASHPAAQLLREHLRLYALIKAAGPDLEPQTLAFQRDLVQSRVRILQVTLVPLSPPTTIRIHIDRYTEQWLALQPLLTAWSEDLQNEALQQQIVTAMETMELESNQLLRQVNVHLEDEMQRWTAQALWMNRLVSGGSFALILVILVMYLTLVQFARTQAVHQQALLDGKQRLQAILDVLPDAVYLINHQGIYTDYKPPRKPLGESIENHSSYHAPDHHEKVPAEGNARDSVCGRSVTEVLPSAVAQQVMDGIDRVLTSGQEWLFEYQLPDGQGEQLREYEARLLPSGHDAVQMVVRDITVAKQEEEAILRSQKMEGIGVLAGGIAHDFNNLLTGMLGQASLATAKLERNLPAIDHIKKVIVSAERAADLTRQLLAYTGKGKFHIIPVDVNQLIHDTTGLMETALPPQVQLAVTFDEQLPLIYADRGQIQQVVMNLFINAVEAIGEEGGQVTIHTATTDIYPCDERNRNIDVPSELAVGRHIVLSVSDTGSGMDPSTMERIFDPFFSTKSQGHGLGLSAIVGIIRMHKGALRVKSQLGKGTTFTIWLPAVADTITVTGSPNPHAPGREAVKQQQVLVIDDEEAIRETVTDILSEQGIAVTGAANGYDGVNLFQNCHEDIDVVLLDMKMPGIDGKETFCQLQAIQPDLKVIFVSGCDQSELGRDFQFSERIKYLPKPYSARSLTERVQEMLTI